MTGFVFKTLLKFSLFFAHISYSCFRTVFFFFWYLSSGLTSCFGLWFHMLPFLFLSIGLGSGAVICLLACYIALLGGSSSFAADFSCLACAILCPSILRSMGMFIYLCFHWFSCTLKAGVLMWDTLIASSNPFNVFNIY